MEWSVLADGSNYIAAVNNMQIASEQATLLLKFLVDNGKTTWGNVHIVGFSLGGQMAGQIGWRVQGRGGMINQITGNLTTTGKYPFSISRFFLNIATILNSQRWIPPCPYLTL